MAYSLTSAATPKLLLAAIVTFATAQGWTIEYDKSTGVGTGVGGQIALSSGACHIAIGEETATQNPINVTGPEDDGRLYMALADSITPSQWQYWNHPGSNVTTAADVDRTTINDILGPMTEVHFFGNSTYILVNVRSSTQRWTSFGFGNLDKKGMSIGDVAFCISNYQTWFDNTSTGNSFRNASLINGCSYWANNSSAGNGAIATLRVPNGVLDTSYGFLSGNIYASMIAARHGILPFSYSSYYPELGTDYNIATLILDHVSALRNQATTGGVGLSVAPVFYWDQTLDLQTFVGEIPGVRICRMSNLSPGQLITYGTDNYLIFPWKQKGLVADAGFTPSGFVAGNYNGLPNSFDMGYAFLK